MSETKTSGLEDFVKKKTESFLTGPLRKPLAIACIVFTMTVVATLIILGSFKIFLEPSTLSTIQAICLTMIAPPIAYYYTSTSESNKAKELELQYFELESKLPDKSTLKKSLNGDKETSCPETVEFDENGNALDTEGM